jgi:LCP family protein required for cell wall assembly
MPKSKTTGTKKRQVTRKKPTAKLTKKSANLKGAKGKNRPRIPEIRLGVLLNTFETAIKNKPKLISKTLGGILVATTFITVISILITQILPLRFLLPLIIVPTLITTFIMYLTFRKKRRTTRARIALSVVSGIFILLYSVVIFYAQNTSNLLGLFDRHFRDSTYVDRVRDITRNPFILYISGHDDSEMRSDVNQLVVVNPRTRKILIHNTPRDYGIYINGDPNKYDKLVHAGIYGTGASVNALEKLYNIDINYFVQINFETLVGLVDAIGGITVDSPFAFSIDGYRFRRGTNQMNGKQALAFSRERMSLPGGDNTRGENQQLVLNAILSKLMSPAILANYTGIISALDGTFTTSFTSSEIARFVRWQLDVQPNWTIEHSNVIGRATMVSTYTYPNLSLYVTEPNQESVRIAIEKIREVLK